MRTQYQILTLCLSFLLAACSQTSPPKLADAPPIVKASASPKPSDLSQITVDKIKLHQDNSYPYAIVALRLDPSYLELRTLEVAKIKVVVQLANGQIVEVINQSKLNWQIPDPRLLNHLNGTLKALQTGETFVKVQIGQHQAELKVKILTSGSGSGSGSISPPQLKLGRTDYPLAVGESVYLDAKLLMPDGSESKDLIYSVDKAEFFELDAASGRLRRLKEGAATVTVQARLNGNVQQTVSITNKAPEKSSGGGGGGGGGGGTSPSATVSPSPSPSASVSASPSASATPSPSPTVSASSSLTPSSTPQPSPTPTIDTTTSKIVFVAIPNGETDQEIFIMDADGSNNIQLTRNTFDDVFPDLSPDRSQIVFQSDRVRDNSYDIFLMNIDGSNQVNISNNKAEDSQPDWSPDGTQIAFISRRLETSPDLYIMDKNGDNVTYLTDLVKSPDWSPDGNKLIFQSFKNHYPNWDIYVIDKDGLNETNLTNSPERPYDMDPVWSPDGSKIAFTSQYLVDELTKHPIHIMNSDGTNETPRLDLVKPSSFELAWSPDGLQFAFEHDGIAIINVDGSGELIKLTSSHIGGLPSWK